MNNIYNFYREIFSGIVKENICLWLAHNLEKAEVYSNGLNLSSTSTGLKRKRRPFLSVFCKGDTFAVLYLTLSPIGYQKSVDLNNCEKNNCSEFPFQDKAYLFRKQGKYPVIPMNRLQIEEIATLCGCCKNLERMRNFCSQLEEANNGA